MEEKWWNMIQAAITRFTPPDLKDCVREITSIAVTLPALFSETTDLVFSNRPVPLGKVQNIMHRLLDFLSILGTLLHSVQNYHQRYENIRWEKSSGTEAKPDLYTFLRTSQSQEWPILQANYLVCWILTGRLLYALSPARFKNLEVTCQLRSREIIAWHSNASHRVKSGLLGGLYMIQSVCVAQSVVHTEEVWSSGCDYDLATNNPVCKEEDLIEAWVFKEWCDSIGRSTSRG